MNHFLEMFSSSVAMRSSRLMTATLKKIQTNAENPASTMANRIKISSGMFAKCQIPNANQL